MAEEGQVIAVHTVESWKEQIEKGNDSKKLVFFRFCLKARFGPSECKSKHTLNLFLFHFLCVFLVFNSNFCHMVVVLVFEVYFDLIALPLN